MSVLSDPQVGDFGQTGPFSAFVATSLTFLQNYPVYNFAPRKADFQLQVYVEVVEMVSVLRKRVLSIEY